MTPREIIQTNPDYRRELLDVPIPYLLMPVSLEEMVLGLAKDRSIGMVATWSHKTKEQIIEETAYHQFPDIQAKARAKLVDYEALEADILKRGVLKPLIGWRHPDTGKVHILVGMRRAEITGRHGLATHMNVALIQEDIRVYWKYDATIPNSRQARLKAHLGEVEYL